MRISGRIIEDISLLRYRRLIEEGVREAPLWESLRKSKAARKRYPGSFRNLRERYYTRG